MTPLACNIGVLSPSERQAYDALTRDLFSAATDRTPTRSGYTFELDAKRVTPAEVGQWIAFEQRCCPFFDFRLDVARENGRMTLTLGGPEGVQAFIDAEFAAVTSSP